MSQKVFPWGCTHTRKAQHIFKGKILKPSISSWNMRFRQKGYWLCELYRQDLNNTILKTEYIWRPLWFSFCTLMMGMAGNRSMLAYRSSCEVNMEKSPIFLIKKSWKLQTCPHPLQFASYHTPTAYLDLSVLLEKRQFSFVFLRKDLTFYSCGSYWPGAHDALVLILNPGACTSSPGDAAFWEVLY